MSQSTRALKLQRIQSISAEIIKNVKSELDKANERISSGIEKIKNINKDEFSCVYHKKISKVSATNIKILAREFGIPIPNEAVRKDSTSILLNAINRAVDEYTNPKTLISIDVGIKNMAVAEFDMLNVKKVFQHNLHSFPAFPGRALAAEYALQINPFCESLPSGIYLIEQQMQKQNIKCSVVEAQLHAFLCPARSISPRSVSCFFGLIHLPKCFNNVHYDSLAKSNFKKKVGVELVKEMLRNGEILSGEESLRFLEEDGKKDDVCDAILNGLAYQMWQRKLIASGIEFLDS